MEISHMAPRKLLVMSCLSWYLREKRYKDGGLPQSLLGRSTLCPPAKSQGSAGESHLGSPQDGAALPGAGCPQESRGRSLDASLCPIITWACWLGVMGAGVPLSSRLFSGNGNISSGQKRLVLPRCGEWGGHHPPSSSCQGSQAGCSEAQRPNGAKALFGFSAQLTHCDSASLLEAAELSSAIPFLDGKSGCLPQDALANW